MTTLLLVNVALFVPAALVGAATCAFGWMLAGHSGEDGGNGGGGTKVGEPIDPQPLSVAPLETIRRRDLARSA